ncbi:MAG: hypothetical protein ACT4OX_10040 [Actinomycetota bacterium]
MAFVIARADGRFEIRESRATDRGPRARTLVSFDVLTEDVLDVAVERARALIDRPAVRAKAVALGAPYARDRAAATMRKLIGQLRRGDRPPAALVSLLRAELPRAPRSWPDSLDGAAEWIGRSDVARGDALRDLLALASAVPHRRRKDTLEFPPIHTRSTR